MNNTQKTAMNNTPEHPPVQRGGGNAAEPLAAILAEMRDRPFSWSMPSEIPGVEKCNCEAEKLANRIEAAVERERNAHINDIHNALYAATRLPGNAAAMRDTHGVTGDGWYGFDLDGTLARYDGWKGIDHIGEPISAMVALIKRLHAEGKIVKIMTARVAPRNDTVDGHDARYYVCKWCAKHLGFTPDVVFQKDARMIQLYDDRVKQVVPNTGILVENLAGCVNAAALREALKRIVEWADRYVGRLCFHGPSPEKDGWRTASHAANDALALARAALAAPPRN